MAISIKININKSLYVKDPQETKLGRDIINHSLLMIDKYGFDKFTFKKLAGGIDSNEPSIYRYFTSKHQLLMYLNAWYWSWIEYRIDSQTNNLKDPKEELLIVIRALSELVNNDPNFSHIRQDILTRIVIKESSKSYIYDKIPEENKELIYRAFYSLCFKIAEIIKKVNPNYLYPEALAICIVKTTHEQIFSSMYFPKFTKLKSFEENSDEIADFVANIALSVLNK
jgi:AcrR family transcriptional regulator